MYLCAPSTPKARFSRYSSKPAATNERRGGWCARPGRGPSEWVTDKSPAYGAALRDLQLKARHIRAKQANNRAESSHVPVRRRERKLQGFKSPRAAQRFLTMHAATYNNFNVCRHLITGRLRRFPDHVTSRVTRQILRPKKLGIITLTKHSR